MTSFDRIKQVVAASGRSPIAGSGGQDLLDPELEQVRRSVQESTHRLSDFIPRARAFAGRWFLEQDLYHGEKYEFGTISAIQLLAEGGADNFLDSFDLDEEQREIVSEFLTDIVRIEWQFAQLVADKPENTASYQDQLRHAYSHIVNHMKAELPNLPWVSRSRVGARIAA
jgi:hypothetical protein